MCFSHACTLLLHHILPTPFASTVFASLLQHTDQTPQYSRYTGCYKTDQLLTGVPPLHSFPMPATCQPSFNTPHHPSAPKGKDPSKSPRGPRSACSICLGQHSHLIHKCDSNKLWDGSEPFCQRAANGCLITKDTRTTLCSDWQHPQECKSSSHPLWHLCSGCGSPDHGTQDCPRAEKGQSTHTIQP